MVDTIVESFKRLYQNKKINENTLNSLVERGVISENDKKYIMTKDGEDTYVHNYR